MDIIFRLDSPALAPLTIFTIVSLPFSFEFFHLWLHFQAHHVLLALRGVNNYEIKKKPVTDYVILAQLASHNSFDLDSAHTSTNTALFLFL